MWGPLNGFQTPLMGTNLQFEKLHYFSPPRQLLIPASLSAVAAPDIILPLGNFYTNCYRCLTDLPTWRWLPRFHILHKRHIGSRDSWVRVLHCLPMPFILKKINPRAEVHTQETSRTVPQALASAPTLQAFRLSRPLPHPSPSRPFVPAIPGGLGERKAFGIITKVLNSTYKYIHLLSKNTNLYWKGSDIPHVSIIKTKKCVMSKV